jgi:O-antigen/teichoic acid export membrane protein
MLDKIKSLSKQTLIYGTSTIIGRFLNFILVPFYTNVFPPSEYGIVAVIFAYMAFLNIVYTLGFEAGYFRFASSKEIGTEKENFSIPFLIILGNALVLSIIIFIASGPISGIIGITDVSMVRYAAFILFFDALTIIPFAFLRLKNKARLFASVKLVNICVNVAMNMILILVFKMGLIAVFISNLAASIITLIILLPVITKNLSFSFNKELFSELRKFSLPYLPAGLASIVVQVIYIPIIQYLTDMKTVGIYNANYKLGIFMMLIVAMFDYAWRPFFLNNAKEPNAKQLFSKILTFFIGASSLILILLTFFIDKVIEIPLPFKGGSAKTYLIGEKYWSGVIIVPVVLFSYIFLGTFTNLVAGIYIEKKTKYMPLITGLGAAVNIAACFILIPLIGIIGGAISSLLGYLTTAAFTYYVVQKFYPVKYEISRLIAMYLINTAAIIIFYLTYPGLDLFLRFIFFAVFASLLIYISGLYKAKNVLIRSKVRKADTTKDEALIETETREL